MVEQADGHAVGRIEVVVVGDVNPDLILTGCAPVIAFGQHEHLVDGAALTLGGSAGITATALARLGLATTLIGAVGDDDLGRLTRDQATALGVDTGAVLVEPGTGTGITVHLMTGDDRAMLTHPGAMARVRGRDVPDGLLAAADHVHLAGLFLLDDLRADAAGLLARARDAGCTTSVDPNWDPSGRWDLDHLYPLVDVLLPNEAEALALSGRHDLDAAVDALAALVPTVAVKAGTGPAIAVDASGGRVRLPPPLSERVVDTIGAGDSFDAGFLAGTLRGRPLGERLALALAVGSLSVTGSGGTGAHWTATGAAGLAATVLDGPAPSAR